jgi:Uma2 family endonuclease
MAIAAERTTIVYPTGDGEPVAETYAHMYVMFITLEILRQYLVREPAIVLANQFLYYAQGFPKLCVAPDVMVIFNVAPGGRDSYKTWEEGEVPRVIFEMTSARTQEKDKEQKKELYQGLGVEEYWLFDPRAEWIKGSLLGYRLVEGEYQPICDSKSEALQLRLEPSGQLINFYRLDNGEKLLTPAEMTAAREQERIAKNQEQLLRSQLIERLIAKGIDPESL